MRRTALVFFLALALAPAQSYAKVRVGWLITAIGTTVATVGLGAESALLHGLSALEREAAETSSSSTYSTYYNVKKGDRYYSSYGVTALSMADTYRTAGWVCAGAAVVTGIVAVIAWPQIKTRPVDDGAASLLQLQQGSLALGVPELQYQPATQGYRVDLLRANF